MCNKVIANSTSYINSPAVDFNVQLLTHTTIRHTHNTTQNASNNKTNMDRLPTKDTMDELIEAFKDKILALVASTEEHAPTDLQVSSAIALVAVGTASYFDIAARRKRSPLKIPHVLAQHHVTTAPQSSVPTTFHSNAPSSIITTHHTITAQHSTSNIIASSPSKLDGKASGSHVPDYSELMEKEMKRADAEKKQCREVEDGLRSAAHAYMMHGVKKVLREEPDEEDNVSGYVERSVGSGDGDSLVQEEFVEWEGEGEGEGEGLEGQGLEGEEDLASGSEHEASEAGEVLDKKPWSLSPHFRLR
jgi:hypothetical protein